MRVEDRGADATIRLTAVESIGALQGSCGSIEAGPASEVRGTGTYNRLPASFRVCAQDNRRGRRGEPDRFVLTCTAGCSYSPEARTSDDNVQRGELTLEQD